MRQLKDSYIKSGQVRFGYIQFIIKGPDSQLAAEATECAMDEGEEMFWAYHDHLFEVAMSEAPVPFNAENLKAFAAELGLNPAGFKGCLDARKYQGPVEIDTQLGWMLGFQGTPTFLINGRVLVGAQPMEVFEQYIEAELAQAGQ